MFSIAATSGNWDNVETCLIKARRIFNGETEENETESQDPGEVVNPGEGLSCNWVGIQKLARFKKKIK